MAKSVDNIRIMSTFCVVISVLKMFAVVVKTVLVGEKQQIAASLESKQIKSRHCINKQHFSFSVKEKVKR